MVDCGDVEANSSRVWAAQLGVDRVVERGRSLYSEIAPCEEKAGNSLFHSSSRLYCLTKSEYSRLEFGRVLGNPSMAGELLGPR